MHTYNSSANPPRSLHVLNSRSGFLACMFSSQRNICWCCSFFCHELFLFSMIHSGIEICLGGCRIHRLCWLLIDSTTWTLQHVFWHPLGTCRCFLPCNMCHACCVPSICDSPRLHETSSEIRFAFNSLMLLSRKVDNNECLLAIVPKKLEVTVVTILSLTLFEDHMFNYMNKAITQFYMSKHSKQHNPQTFHCNNLWTQLSALKIRNRFWLIGESKVSCRLMHLLMELKLPLSPGSRV